MTFTGLQRVHHLCLRLKHAFNARHPRTFVQDTFITRSIVGILKREGYLNSVLVGDDRGPFVDICDSVRKSSVDFKSILTDRQKERLEVLSRTRDTLLRLHSLFDSDGSQTLVFDNLSSDQLGEAMDKADQHSKAKASNRFPDSMILSSIKVLPSIDSLPIPTLDDSTSPQDLYNITWEDDRRLWMDLRYDSHMVPALTDMFLVSKGSRKVYTDVQELKDILEGKRFNAWKGSDIGAVTFIRTENGEIISGHDAIEKGIGGEVLCIAK